MLDILDLQEEAVFTSVLPCSVSVARLPAGSSMSILASPANSMPDYYQAGPLGLVCTKQAVLFCSNGLDPGAQSYFQKPLTHAMDAKQTIL